MNHQLLINPLDRWSSNNLMLHSSSAFFLPIEILFSHLPVPCVESRWEIGLLIKMYWILKENLYSSTQVMIFKICRMIKRILELKIKFLFYQKISFIFHMISNLFMIVMCNINSTQYSQFSHFSLSIHKNDILILA